MESDASFLKSRLQTSQLLVQADSAIDGEMAEIPFIFIFKGMQQENATAIEALLIQGLKDFMQEPIDSHKIDAAIHQLMIDRLEITDDQGPFGLSLFFRSVLLMQHGAMAEEGLFVHQQFDALKKKLLDPNYLKGLIEKHLIHNPHRVSVVLKANAQLEKIEQEKELALLSKRYLAMTEEEKQAIRRQSQKLEQYQENLRHQDLSVLPSIELSDIALTHKDFPLQTFRSDQLQIHVHETWTNDFTYVDWLYELPALRIEELSLMKFLIGIYTELGFGKEDYETTLEKIQAHTGGLSAYFQILTHIDDPKFLKPLFGLRGKALFSQIKPFFELMKKAQSGVNLDDTDRLLDLVKQTYTYLRDKINRSGLNYCIKEALSSFSPYNFINQQMSGIPYFQAISALHHEMKKEPQAVALRLKALHHKALTHLNGQLVMSLDSESLHHLKDRDFYGCGQLTTKNSTPFSLDSFHSKKQDKHLEIASPVAFVCEAYSVFTIQDPLSAALTLAPSIMESGTLHPLIREKGGAYGSGATYQSIIGNFYFHSYRDPHVADTYKAFQKSIERLINGDFDEEMLKEAKLEFIQDYDAPVTPGMRAQTSFFYAQTGRSLQFREDYKKRILSVTKNDVMEAVKKAFTHQTPCRVFACNAQLFKAEKSQLDKMGMVLITEKILKL
jgi:Zn-dependent M16 (insulinase) family peptidase